MQVTNKISVVIPTYNRAKTIRRCLESVINQTHKIDEIIVIDDYSQDNTKSIVKSIDKSIKYIENSKNCGAQHSRNVGIKNASHPWIAFIDSDDEWLPQKIEKQFQQLSKVKFNLSTVVHGNCNVINEKSGISEYWDLPLVNGKNAYTALLDHSGTVFPSILTSKKALENIGYLDENVVTYHEWETSIRLAEKCNFIHIQKSLFNYFKHEDNTISLNSRQNFRGYQYIFEKHYQTIMIFLGQTAIDEHLLTIGKLAFEAGDYGAGRESFKKISNPSIVPLYLKIMGIFRINPKFVNNIVSFLKRI